MQMIIREVISHNNAERQKIKRKYFIIYRTNLEVDLISVFSDNFLKGVLMLMKPNSVSEAELLHHAMKGLGTDEDLLIDLMCSKTASELKLVADEFGFRYKESLKSWIQDDTSGDFRKLLVKLTERDDSSIVNAELAKKDAEALFEAGENKWGTDENKFIDIFTKRNFSQLHTTFRKYKKEYDNDIEAVIESEMSGDLAKAIVTIGNIYLLFFIHSSFGNPKLIKF